MKSQNFSDLTIEEQVLSNHLVLESVFRNLDQHSLLQCRLLNSTWNFVACTFLENRFVVRVHRLQKFIDAFLSLIPGISITVFKLEYSITPDHTPAPMYLANLHAICASQVKYLELDVDLLRRMSRSRTNSDDNEKVCCAALGKCVEGALTLIHCHCPHLHTLQLNLKVDTEDPLVFGSSSFIHFQPVLEKYQSQSLPNLKNVEFAFRFRGCKVPQLTSGEGSLCGALVKTLLTSAEQLESVKLVGVFFEEAPPVKQFFIGRVLSNVTCYRHLREVKIFHSAVSSSNICLLSGQHFSSLQRIYLKIDTESESIPDFKSFLSFTSSALQELELDFTEPHGVAIVPLPGGITMRQLHSLTLHNFHGPIEFGRLPRLKSLNLKLCPLQESIHCPLLSKVAPFHLDKLLIYFPAHAQHSQMSLSFPLVTPLHVMICNLSALTLECRLSPMMLPLIFEECKQLVRVNLWECQGVTDGLLCGVKGSLLNVAWPAVTVYSEDIVRFRPLVTRAMSREQVSGRSSFVGDLKGLRYLSVKERHSSQLTDASVLFGIVHCKKLKELELKSSKVGFTGNILQVVLDTSTGGTKRLVSNEDVAFLLGLKLEMFSYFRNLPERILIGIQL